MKASRLLTLAVLVSLIATAGASAKVTLDYWDKWGDFQSEFIKKAIKRFNDSHPGIEVKYTLVDVGSIRQKFLTAAVAGKVPDVVGLWNHILPEFVTAGLIEPLDPYLKRLKMNQSSIIPNYWDMMNINGRVYGLPITCATFVLYTNRTVLSESGLDPESDPETFDGLDAMALKIERKDGSGKFTRVGFLPNDPGWWPGLWPTAFGATIYDAKNNAIDFKQPGMLNAYNWVSNTSKRLGVNITMKLSGSRLTSGKTGMEINGSLNPSGWARNNKDFKYGVMNMPYGKGGTKDWGWIEADVLAMPKGKHMREASEFITFMMGPDVQREFNLSRETFSAVKAVNTPEFIKANANPAIGDLIGIASSRNAAPAPKTMIWADIEFPVYNTIFDKVWSQRKSPQQTLDEAAKSTAPILAKVSRRKR